ncbi:MAG: hypothetical protein C0402_05625 [Thermodesulfovibrio sp.]|nr:hypothetical protein [Thermodesulfovibrio sp.]
MTCRYGSITSTTTTIAVIIAIVVTMVIPAAYFMISYQYKGGSIEAQAELSARSVERLVMANPKMWQFEEIRLQELLQHRHNQDLPEVRLIRDAGGDIVAQIAESPSPPLITRYFDIFDAGIPVARLELSQSLVPLIVRTAVVGSLSFLLGLLIFVVLRTVPLRAVRKAYQAVEESEQALRQSEEKFRAIYENIGIGIALIGKDMQILSINRQMKKWFPNIDLGQHPDPVCYRSFNDPPRDSICSYCPTVLTLKDGQVHTEVTDTPAADGVRNYLVIATPLLAADGSISAAIEMVEDVTDRKRAEEKLRQSEEFVRRILDTVDEGFIVIDRDYRILTANKAYCSQIGDCGEKIIGSHCYEKTHNKSRPCHEEGEECAVRQVFETGKPHTTLHRHKDTDGSILYAETKAYPIYDASGAVSSVIETIANITEKHLLEEERLKTQKLESIGTLAGGIAHDFNNLLQGVFGYISMARMTIDRKEKALSMLDQAEEALHLSVNLTTQLLTFSKGGKPVKKLTKILPIVENAVKFALSGSHTSYRMENPADLWSVEADGGQLAQVIQNIVLNANEAMSGSGTVAVSLANMEIPKDVVAGLPDGGPFVRIAIQDSGIGIPEENLARIFDPYFTTKPKGGGLGLATSYSIIRNHGGVIEVKSVLGRGTEFTIYLPASSAAGVEAGTTVSQAVGTKKGRILLMDDEDMVRNVAREMIAALGHEAVCAEDGQKAIDLFRQAKETGTPYDLVILDLTVKGGMGGEEAIKAIRDIDPVVKAVVSSGYADSPVIADYRAHGFSAVLSKPYRIDSLQHCLNLFIA